MRYKNLLRSDLKISELGIGTYPLKGHWGAPINDKTSKQIISKALDLGINIIDTADVYGLGLTERLIGNLLKGKSGSKEIYMATKGGRDFTSKPGKIFKNFDSKYLERALTDSLERLKKEAVDFYFLHGPEKLEIEKGEIFSFLDFVKKKGLIRHSGISVNNDAEIPLILCQYKPDIISVAFNILSQFDIKLVSKICEEKGVNLFIREPLGQGLLSGKYTSNSKFPNNDHRSTKWTKEFWSNKEKDLKNFKKLNFLGNSLTQKALGYVLSLNEGTTVFFGAKSVPQVIENISVLRNPLLVREIKSIETLRQNRNKIDPIAPLAGLQDDGGLFR